MPDPKAVNFMFTRIARRYDLANRILSGGMDLWWRRQLVAAATRNAPADVLDLATGSGDVALALSRNLPHASKITGMDFCEPMLDVARAKQAAKPGAHDNVRFASGDGMDLPLANASFDVVTIAFGLRNMADRSRALGEMRRVLRPGGRLCLLEFSQPRPWLRPCYLFYLRRLLPSFAGWITRDRPAYVYLNDTIRQFPDAPALADEMHRAGFSAVAFRQMSGGIVALHEARA